MKEKEILKGFSLLFITIIIISCTGQNQRIKEAGIEYEKKAKELAIKEMDEWQEMKKLALLATGVTSSVKEERKRAYVKLIQLFPESKRWDDIVKSIDQGEMYSEYEDFIWEIKKAKGWQDIE